ncbi:right-handed parallel beta-helix repeat-containing protein [Cryptosporangium phraense]|uniref:right-handed parallel beta-helix repeat-containing protein n=1 Tax=Cryptosporangium phraense TaxID=2593070 RepID=UPI00147826D9|nr:right-handed parallel beta-helix repeat-containing protein [Cryptosporangium phraense]
MTRIGAALRLLTAAAVAAAVLIAPGPAYAAGRTFYLSPLGDDAADGQSLATAWKTLGRAGQERLRPGDSVLLQGGARFDGQLLLVQDDGGTEDAPVTIATYGTGRATIKASGLEAIKVYDAGGITIRGLDIVGDASTYDTWSGVLFYADDKVPARPSDVTLTDLDVSGFQLGIAFAGASPGRGFRNVAVTDTKVHGNRDDGLLFYGPAFDASNPSYAHSDVVIRGVTAYDNAGNPKNTATHSGSGIVLGSVRNGVIEQSSAFHNGFACASAGEGPVGIWTYDSTGVTIQRNVSYRNRTGTTADGGGFDLDQNVSDSVLQYNLSYENSGPGLLVFTARTNGALRGNTVRFNVSVGDAQGNGWYGGLTVAGQVADTAIYHNTIVTRRSAAVKLREGLTGVSIRNNVLLSQGAGAAVEAPDLTTANVRFDGNAYYRAGGGPVIKWGDGLYASVADWRADTGQGPGLDVDPKLQDPSATPSVTDPGRLTSVTQFALAGDSPAGGAGVKVASPGGVDYFGAPLAGRPVSIGAAQPATVAPADAAPGAKGRTTWLWVVAVVLLVVVGGGASVTAGVAAGRRSRRRRAVPAPRRPEAQKVPSQVGDDRQTP